MLMTFCVFSLANLFWPRQFKVKTQKEEKLSFLNIHVISVCVCVNTKGRQSHPVHIWKMWWTYQKKKGQTRTQSNITATNVRFVRHENTRREITQLYRWRHTWEHKCPYDTLSVGETGTEGHTGSLGTQVETIRQVLWELNYFKICGNRVGEMDLQAKVLAA